MVAGVASLPELICQFALGSPLSSLAQQHGLSEGDVQAQLRAASLWAEHDLATAEDPNSPQAAQWRSQMRLRQLVALDALCWASWQAWLKSTEPLKTTQAEHVTTQAEGAKGDGKETNRRKDAVRLDHRAGDAAHLRLCLQCVTARGQLLGLNAMTAARLRHMAEKSNPADQAWDVTLDLGPPRGQERYYAGERVPLDFVPPGTVEP